MYDVLIAITGWTVALAMIGIVMFVPVWAAMKLASYGRDRIKQQDVELQEKLQQQHGNIKIFRGFPLPHKYEDVIQGAFEDTIQSLRMMVTNDEWILAEISFRSLESLTLHEQRNATAVTVYATPLDEYTPQIAVRARKGKNILFRNLQAKIQRGELVECEGVFGAKQQLYSEKGSQIDILSILSPEILEALQSPPFDADIYFKRSVLYYMFRTRHNPYETLAAIAPHADRLKLELHDNLRRWAAAGSNQGKLEYIRQSELAETLREKYERGML